MTATTKGWIKGIERACISGAATGVGSWVGLITASAVGLAVPTLNFKALGIVMVMGALTNLSSYFQKSPLPDSVETTQVTVTQTKESTKE